MGEGKSPETPIFIGINAAYNIYIVGLYKNKIKNSVSVLFLI